VKGEFAIVSYIRFKERGGGEYLPYNYQNYYINETRSYNGVDYDFAPLGVAGGGGKQGGERSRGAIVCPANAIVQNIFWQADSNKWLAEVTSVEVDTVTDQELAQLTRIIWACKVEGSIEIGKPGQSVLQLSSPLDTVNATVGGRPLSQTLVGALPTTGSISV
jgi:hypothetical protein